jgi:hypothetical protein
MNGFGLLRWYRDSPLFGEASRYVGSSRPLAALVAPIWRKRLACDYKP